MLLQTIFDRFVAKSPVTVMARLAMERTLAPDLDHGHRARRRGVGAVSYAFARRAGAAAGGDGGACPAGALLQNQTGTEKTGPAAHAVPHDPARLNRSVAGTARRRRLVVMFRVRYPVSLLSQQP